MKNIILVLTVLFSQLSYSSPEIKGSPDELKSFLYPEGKVVVISGFAKENAFSDKAVVNLIVKNNEEKMSQALALNSKLLENIRAELIRSGVLGADINNSKFSQSPQYGWFGTAPDSYEVVNRLSVEISEEKHLKKIVELADENLDLTMGQIQFKHSQKEEYTKKVKMKALDKVSTQKLQYEQALGLKLKPVGIRDAHFYAGATEGAAAVEKVVVYGISGSKKGKSSSYSQARETRSTSFEEVSYAAKIAVEYVVIPE